MLQDACTKDVFREMDGFLMLMSVLSTIHPTFSQETTRGESAGTELLEVTRLTFLILSEALHKHNENVDYFKVSARGAFILACGTREDTLMTDMLVAGFCGLGIILASHARPYLRRAHRKTDNELPRVSRPSRLCMDQVFLAHVWGGLRRRGPQVPSIREPTWDDSRPRSAMDSVRRGRPTWARRPHLALHGHEALGEASAAQTPESVYPQQSGSSALAVSEVMRGCGAAEAGETGGAEAAQAPIRPQCRDRGRKTHVPARHPTRRYTGSRCSGSFASWYEGPVARTLLVGVPRRDTRYPNWLASTSINGVHLHG